MLLTLSPDQNDDTYQDKNSSTKRQAFHIIHLYAAFPVDGGIPQIGKKPVTAECNSAPEVDWTEGGSGWILRAPGPSIMLVFAQRRALTCFPFDLSQGQIVDPGASGEFISIT
ncbi:MAG: hypothetical protein ACXW4C_11795 [Nitrospira sp.]